MRERKRQREPKRERACQSKTNNIRIKIFHASTHTHAPHTHTHTHTSTRSHRKINSRELCAIWNALKIWKNTMYLSLSFRNVKMLKTCDVHTHAHTCRTHLCMTQQKISFEHVHISTMLCSEYIYAIHKIVMCDT